MCSGSKASKSLPAKELYVSERFQRDKVTAQEHYPEWFILSGAYGVLNPDRVIGPYDVDLESFTKLGNLIWTARLALQLLGLLGLGPATVYLRATGRYLANAATSLRLIGFKCDCLEKIDKQGSLVWTRSR